MYTPLHIIPVDSDLKTAKREMKRRRTTCLLVSEGALAVGILAKPDLMRAFVGTKRSSATVRDVMQAPLVAVDLGAFRTAQMKWQWWQTVLLASSTLPRRFAPFAVHFIFRISCSNQDIRRLYASRSDRLGALPQVEATFIYPPAPAGCSLQRCLEVMEEHDVRQLAVRGQERSAASAAAAGTSTTATGATLSTAAAASPSNAARPEPLAGLVGIITETAIYSYADGERVAAELGSTPSSAGGAMPRSAGGNGAHQCTFLQSSSITIHQITALCITVVCIYV